MMSTHVATRRFGGRMGGAETGEGDPSFSRLCLARKDRTRSRLYAATVKPSNTVIFTWPNTRKKPRARSTKDPLRAALTDSTTCRRPMDIRHAVVAKGIRWWRASSAGVAEKVPEQQRSSTALILTRGARRERRKVLGNCRLRR